MKTAVLCLAMLLASAPLCAYERDGLTVSMSKEEAEACDTQGGCLLVPKDVLNAVAEQMTQKAYSQGLHACRNAT